MNKIRAFLDQYLDPSEQLTELLIGLIMVLIITGLARSTYVEEGRDETVDWLQSAMGCNVAWGLITGLMISMNNLYDRSRPIRLQHELRKANDNAEAVAIVQEELEEELEAFTTPEERARLSLHVVDQIKSADMPLPRIQGRDFVGGLIVFFLVTVTALPAYIPLFFDDILLGIRVANILLVSLLFLVGYCWGRVVHMNAWGSGITIMVVGVAMVLVAEWLGG